MNIKIYDEQNRKTLADIASDIDAVLRREIDWARGDSALSVQIGEQPDASIKFGDVYYGYFPKADAWASRGYTNEPWTVIERYAVPVFVLELEQILAHDEPVNKA